jgi:hypothetical protein
MKNFLIAVLLGLILTYSFGHLFTHWFDWQVYVDGSYISGFGAAAIGAVVVVVLVALGFVVALSLFGMLAFVLGTVLLALLVVGVSTMWPIILLVVFVVWLTKSKSKERHHDTYRY